MRAEADRAAPRLLPERPYLVAAKHLRRIGKDCLISLEASFYLVPARRVRPGQRVSVHVHPDHSSDSTAQSNAVLLGPPGVGKTMIALALAVVACQTGFSIYFTGSSPLRVIVS